MRGRRVDHIQTRPCVFDGCETVVTNRLGFCPTHYSIAYPCSFDAACKHRCAAHSKTRLCQEHAWYGDKLRLVRARERGEAAREE